MKLNVTNKKLRIGRVSIQSINASSFVLFGDADAITSSNRTDTPADSLIMKPMKGMAANHSDESAGGNGAQSDEIDSDQTDPKGKPAERDLPDES